MVKLLVKPEPYFGAFWRGLLLPDGAKILAVPTMTPEEREKMNTLCIRIQEEKDHRRFEALLRDLNELIRRKELRFPQLDGVTTHQPSRPWKKVSGTAQKFVRDVSRTRGENVEISIPDAEDLFREIRIDNTFTDIEGQPVALKQGAHVDITFEADAKDTVKRTEDGRA
jgi:hypothetical protein